MALPGEAGEGWPSCCRGSSTGIPASTRSRCRCLSQPERRPSPVGARLRRSAALRKWVGTPRSADSFRRDRHDLGWRPG
jgi:hypothetical protein